MNNFAFFCSGGGVLNACSYIYSIWLLAGVVMFVAAAFVVVAVYTILAKPSQKTKDKLTSSLKKVLFVGLSLSALVFLIEFVTSAR